MSLYFKLFHGTSEENKKSILKNGFTIPERKIKNEDWLGCGIYFFKDKRYAMWWAKEVRKFLNSGIIYTEIECDKKKYLNLSDEGDYDSFFSFYEDNRKNVSISFENKNQRDSFFLDMYKECYGIQLVSKVFDRKGKFLPFFGHNNEAVKIVCQLGYGYPQTQYCVSDNSIIKKISDGGEL